MFLISETKDKTDQMQFYFYEGPLKLRAFQRHYMMLHRSLLASEYLNSKEVSTMYFLICWGHFISKITLLQYVIRIAFLGGSLMVNLSFTIKDPPFFPIHDF